MEGRRHFLAVDSTALKESEALIDEPLPFFSANVFREPHFLQSLAGAYQSLFLGANQPLAPSFIWIFAPDYKIANPCIKKQLLVQHMDIYSPPTGGGCSVWLLDLGLSWHQLTGSFSDYLRLATVHLGLLQWHYALTTNRLSPQYEVCSNTFSGIYYWVNSPIKDNPRIVDKGPCTNLSFIRRFHCISSIYAPQAFYWRDYYYVCLLFS